MAEANVTKNKQLPPEVLVKIFAHCDLDQLVNIVDVCQLWRDVAIREYTTSGNDLVIRRPDDINDLVTLLSKPVSFTKLHVVWDDPEDVYCRSESLDALTNATSLIHLQSFKFEVKDKILKFHSAYDYSLLFEALSTLLRPTSAGTLTHLKLINTGALLSRKVVELLEACQRLTHLVLNGCELFNKDEQRCVNIIPILTHLELLDLRGTGVSDELSFIAAVRRGCRNISNNIMIRQVVVRPTDDVSMLLFVSHVDEFIIGELGTDQLGSLISCLSDRVSRLTVDELYVYHCKNHLTDDLLLSLIKCLRGLKEVRAQGCHRLTNEGVLSVITLLPELEWIDIDDIKNINRGIIQLLDQVVTKEDLKINAQNTNLSVQMVSSPDGRVYTGRNRNICLLD